MSDENEAEYQQEHQPEAETHPETASETEPEAQIEAQVESQPEVQLDSQPDAQPEVQPEAQLEPQPEPQPEPIPDQEPEQARSEPNVEEVKDTEAPQDVQGDVFNMQEEKNLEEADLFSTVSSTMKVEEASEAVQGDVFTLQEEPNFDETNLFFPDEGTGEDHVSEYEDEFAPEDELTAEEDSELTELGASLHQIGTGVSMLPSDFNMKQEQEGLVAEDEKPVSGLEEAPEVAYVPEAEEAAAAPEVEPPSAGKQKVQQTIEDGRRERKKKETSDLLLGVDVVDFDELTIGPDFVIGGSSSFPSFSYETAEEEEEVAEDEGIGGEEPLDREPYYTLFESIAETTGAIKLKNNFLHRKMAEYFRGRKMEHVLKEQDHQPETVQRYKKNLDVLGELKELEALQRETLGREIAEMRDKRNVELKVVDADFQQMHARELEIGTGLKSSKSGKELPEPLLKRLLRRQTTLARQVTTLRRGYFRIRDMVLEQQQALHRLETIAGGLHMFDYEQMKVENQGYMDRIEEMDADLARLRKRCSDVSQVLAHVREKVAATKDELLVLEDKSEDVEKLKVDGRGIVNIFKNERDRLRRQVQKIEDAAGLLSRCDLLRDMEISMETVDDLSVDIRRCKRRYGVQKKRLDVIRARLEETPRETRPLTRDKPKSTSMFYKKRPSMLLPTMPRVVLGYYPIYEPPATTVLLSTASKTTTALTRSASKAALSRLYSAQVDPKGGQSRSFTTLLAHKASSRSAIDLIKEHETVLNRLDQQTSAVAVVKAKLEFSADGGLVKSNNDMDAYSARVMRKKGTSMGASDTMINKLKTAFTRSQAAVSKPT